MKVTFKHGKTEMKAEVTEKEMKLILKVLRMILLAIMAAHGGAP